MSDEVFFLVQIWVDRERWGWGPPRWIEVYRSDRRTRSEGGQRVFDETDGSSGKLADPRIKGSDRDECFDFSGTESLAIAGTDSGSGAALRDSQSTALAYALAALPH